jgi:hypothetical protein
LDTLIATQPESYKLSLIKLTDIVLKLYAHLAKGSKSISTQDIDTQAFMTSVSSLNLNSLGQLPDIAAQHGYRLSKEDHSFLQSLQSSYPDQYQRAFSSSLLPAINRVVPDLIKEYNDAHGLLKAGASTLESTKHLANKAIDRTGDHPVMAATSV